MRIKTFCDGKEEYTLASFDTRELAEAFVKREKKRISVALYPSLSADIGLLCRSPLWGNESMAEALRALSYYLGIHAGWPMENVTVECENGNVISLPLVANPLADILIKTSFCKQTFENVDIFAPFAEHSAVRFAPPHAFLLIDSACVDAVNLSGAESFFSKDAPRMDLPVCFASLQGNVLRLRTLVRDIGEVVADDTMYMCALFYFFSAGRAEKGILYEAENGTYRIVDGCTVEAARRLSPVEFR